ncbi:MAG: hypothetical protein AAB152_04165 [Candidatus Coatesbacteria bacterium]
MAKARGARWTWGEVCRHGAGLSLFTALAVASSCSLADGIYDVGSDSVPPFDSNTYPVLFPNWRVAPISTYWIYECDDITCAGCTTSNITGLTVFNYGTAAAPGDLAGAYFNYVCGGQVSAVYAMTYAGFWAVAGGHPAWTWAGSLPLSTDPCDTSKGCWCFPSINLYADIGACPVDGSTIELAPAYNPVGLRGGLTDSCGTDAPGAPLGVETRYIGYVYKATDSSVAAPGDTVTYTVYYGKPGAVALNTIWVTDSVPQYMHYIEGSAVPPADPGYDPDPGPPSRLRWTFTGPITPTGGATGAITFQAAVDWGNGESFEPGSGDVAAPEGIPLANQAHIAWDPGTCAPGKTSNQVGTTVRRFLFWVIGDNDLLFAPQLGNPDDEMTYSVFVKNVSTTKTWWKVSLWDTVPNEIDVWTPGYGFDDPCAGWTMTPSGCAAASPGRTVAVGKTILTWTLDMPPQMTLEMRWKARVRPTSTAGGTAITITSLMELGRTGVVNGTGHQGRPKNFVQLANIMLRTTYLSYVSVSTINSLGNDGLYVNFYPLNKASNFELRAIEYAGVPYATSGGVSQSIGCLIGDCFGGFAGSAGCTLGSGIIPGGGVAGCKAERIPAMYTAYSIGLTTGTYGNCAASTCGSNPTIPYHVMYKVVSNSPFLWQVLSGACNSDQDQFTYDPTTSLSYSGFIVYGFLRHGAQATQFDMLNLVNTSVGPSDVVDPTLATTIHIFTWEYATNTWDWLTSYEVGEEAQVEPYIMRNTACNRHYRIISSQTKLVSHHGWCALFGPDANNLCHLSPTRTTGLLMSGTVGEAFYLFPGPWDGAFGGARGLVSTAGASATYRLEVYKPRNQVLTPSGGNCGGIPLWLSDTYGSWFFVLRDTVPGGFFPGNNNPPNPRLYGAGYDVATLDAPGNSAGMWRIVLESGGPISVASGGSLYAVWGGGSVIHPYVPVGAKVGTAFWLGEPYEPNGTGCTSGPTINTIAVFCPKNGMSAKCETSMGALSQYTTNGPDQCITFMGFTSVPSGQRRNIRITVTGGNAMVNYNHCIKNHKIFTAPFMESGVHYTIIPPPVVYIGQQFWITVIAVEAAGGTKDDYCGTTSFTSTDPGAKVEGTNMDAYNYTWKSTITPCNAGSDNGVKMFFSVSMTRLGMQTIVATDSMDGSITGLTAVMVVGVDVKLTKEPPLQVVASSDTVQFKICWSNYSSASAFTFVITDAVPMGTNFLPEASMAGLSCGNTDGTALAVGYSLLASPTMPGAASFTGANPVAGTRWLRWTVPIVGVQTSGCACFRAVVQ